MGLDSYLSTRTYVNSSTKLRQIAEILDCAVPPAVHEGVIEMPFMYWRKALFIHNWFVENVQDGKDDCEDYEVSLKALTMLRDVAQVALDNPELAEHVLPGWDISLQSITVAKETVDRLTEEIERASKRSDPDCYWYTYRSSW